MTLTQQKTDQTSLTGLLEGFQTAYNTNRVRHQRLCYRYHSGGGRARRHAFHLHPSEALKARLVLNGHVQFTCLLSSLSPFRGWLAKQPGTFISQTHAIGDLCRPGCVLMRSCWKQFWYPVDPACRHQQVWQRCNATLTCGTEVNAAPKSQVCPGRSLPERCTF